MYTFRNTHRQQIVFVREIGRDIQFVQEGFDADRKPQGVYRTASEVEADALRRLIREGHIPAWEEDEEELQARHIITKRQEAVARKVAAQAAQ